MGHIKRLHPQSNTWESGWWALSELTAARLCGGEIYFHKNQGKSAFFGGEIQSFQVETEGEWAGRIIFTFVAKSEAKGRSAGKDGWAMEKKVVWDD
jgi:hypothetical protein